MHNKLLLLFMSMGILLAGCTSPSADSSTSTVTQEESSPTAVAQATDTPIPTDTPAPTATAMPTDTPTPEPTATVTPTVSVATVQDTEEIFTVYDNKPVVPNGPAGAWDDQFTDPGAVVYHDGMYHMFHNGFVGWPAPVGITYSNSPDGYEWTHVVEQPVFKGDDLDYVGLTVLASSALVEDDGTWVLYFYTWDRNSWPAPGAIGRATASDPTGPWTADEELVLEPGSEGAWDSYAVRAPSVVRTDEGYLMFYAGYTEDQGMIGMATSNDGINWTKYDDPATTETLFAESDPVFEPAESGSWDWQHVVQPRVEQTPDGLVMLYSGATAVNGSGTKLGYAISPDGINWTRSEEPVLEAIDVPGGRAIWFTELLYQDDTYFLFFELGTGGMTEVYLATHEGPLNNQ